MNATNSAVQDENDSECLHGACLSRSFCKSPRDLVWEKTPKNPVWCWGAEPCVLPSLQESSPSG